MQTGRSRLETFWQFLQHEIGSRYRGSMLGVAWSFVIPLAMLGVFTFAFGVVMKTRWPGYGDNTTDFALIVFAGLTTFNIFAEVLSRAPTLITAQPNLVKKVVFPLEVLPPVLVGSALFHAAIAFVVFFLMQFLVVGLPPLTAVLLPAVLVPLVLFSVGVAWLLASLGVFVRDIPQITGPLVTALLFLSPVFFPLSSLPEWLQGPAALSPIAQAVEQVRDVLVYGRLPDLLHWGLSLIGGAALAAAGYWWFIKTRKGFADVL